MTTSMIHPGHHHASAAEQHAQLVKNTQKWVAQTFFGTMLKQMREDPFKSEMFDGGRGGEAFGAMYDQELADHMGRSAGKPLVDSIVRKIEGANAYRKASKLTSKAAVDANDAMRKSRVEASVAASDSARWTKP